MSIPIRSKGALLLDCLSGDFPNPGPGLQRAHRSHSIHHCLTFSVIPVKSTSNCT